VQHLVEQQPVDAAPDQAQPERGCLPELGDGVDAGAVEPLLHTRADAVDLVQFEAEQNLWQVLLGDDDEPVRLLQVGADLAEKNIGRDADRAGEAFADLLAKGALDLQCPLARNRDLALGSHQPAGHLVDGTHLLDRQAGVDGRENSLVIVGIEPVIRLHRDHLRAHTPRLAHDRASLGAEGLGGVAGGNGDDAIRECLDDDDGLAAQGRDLLLLARREERIEIEEQPLDSAT
jgi:hypothetical protein